jgi:hypothetical protein
MYLVGIGVKNPNVKECHFASFPEPSRSYVYIGGHHPHYSSQREDFLLSGLRGLRIYLVVRRGVDEQNIRLKARNGMIYRELFPTCTVWWQPALQMTSVIQTAMNVNNFYFRLFLNEKGMMIFKAVLFWEFLVQISGKYHPYFMWSEQRCLFTWHVQSANHENGNSIFFPRI